MAFEAFVTRDSHRRHRRRLGTSSLLAAALLALGLAIGARAAAGHAAPAPAVEAPDEVLDVKLADRPPPPPEPPPAPAPPAPAALVPRTVRLNPDAPPPRPVVDPKEVPRDRPREADPSQDRGVAGVHEGGDAAGVGAGRPGAGGGGGGAAPAPPPPPPASTAPPAPKVTTISEDTEPPVPLSQARPQPPADFIAAGEDAVVVVKFEVTEAGAVANARIVKGHPLLDAVVLAAVRGWTFRPAMSQGRPVAYPKTVKLPFRIRT